MPEDLIGRLRAGTVRSYLRTPPPPPPLPRRRGMTPREILDRLGELPLPDKQILGQGPHRPSWADQPTVVKVACCYNWIFDGRWHTCVRNRHHVEVTSAAVRTHACTCREEQGG